MRQNEVRPASGSRSGVKRVGRGNGSGHGTYSGRGCKGQKSRSGGGVRPGFEGGQLSLIKRLPRKRGFTSIFRTEYSIVSVEKLNVFPSGTEVTPEALLQAGLVKSLKKPIKILGGGEVYHALLIKADRFSASAQDKIVAAGGKVEKARDAT